MPSTEQILTLLASTAQSWQALAALWHLYFGAIAAVLLFGLRPPVRLCGMLIALPILSVGAVSWICHNPFNGIIYSLVGIATVSMAVGLPTTATQLAPPWARIPGAFMFIFGWVYPHFLETSSWVTYLHSSPIGVIPCPTLSIVIGLALMLNGLASRRLSLTLGIVGTCYGVTGPLLLGVVIDWFLVAGSATLLILALAGDLRGPRSATVDGKAGSEGWTRTKITAWGIGPRLSGITLVYAAVATFVHFGTRNLDVVTWFPHIAFTVGGAGLIAAGVVLWALGARVIDRAFVAGRLLTTGVYGLVRHPMYSAFLVFVPLGIALLLRSWSFLTVPMVAGLSFVSLIRREEDYLEGRFGQSYLDYKARVNGLVPLLHWPSIGRRGAK